MLLTASYFLYWEENKITPDQPIQQIDKPDAIKLEKQLNIMILGADSLIPGKLEGWNGRSDVIVVANFNPFTKQVSIISIPRDTYIELKKHKDIHRINSANQLGGYKLSKRVVQKLLGLKIDHVIVFSMKSAIELLETIGPVKIFVPVDMQYHDSKAGLHINIKAGLQKLKGAQIMNFLRYRNIDKGDIGRIERQHIFFRAALKRLSEPAMIFKMPSVLLKAGQTFTTDLSFRELFELGTLLRSLLPSSDNKEDAWDFKSYIVPGNFSSDGSWLPKYPELKAMVKEIKQQ